MHNALFKLRAAALELEQPSGSTGKAKGPPTQMKIEDTDGINVLPRTIQ